MPATFRELKTTLLTIARHRFFEVNAIFVFVFLALSFGLTFWKLWPGILEQSTVPLHYNIHMGIDRIGPWWQIFFCPALVVAIALMNDVLQVVFWKKDRVLSFFLSGATTLVAFILLIAQIFIVLFNLYYYG